MCTGSVGTAPAKQEQTSVPPLTEAIHRSSRTSSCSQRKPSGGSGEPVVATHFDAGQVEVAARVHLGLAAGHDVRGRRAEQGGAGALGHAPLGARVGDSRGCRRTARRWCR